MQGSGDSQNFESSCRTCLLETDAQWAPENEGCISSLEDFENHPWPSIEDVDFSNIKESSKILPAGMKIIARAGDIFTHTWEALGFTGFSYALGENPGLVKKVFERIGSLIYKIAMLNATFKYGKYPIQ